MRILHVTTFLQGGAGRIITALAAAQRRSGNDVIVVADAGGEAGYESYQDYVEQLAGAGVEFHTVRSTFRRDLALNVNAAAALRALLRQRRIDIAHCHAAVPTLVTRLAVDGRAGVPVVQTMHGWGVRKTQEQAATDIALLGLTDAVVTPSAAARATLQALGLRGAPVHVIPYGLESDTNVGSVDAADAGIFATLRAAARPVALCIGTIGTRKDQGLLVEALVSADHVAAVFVGDGDAAPLRRLAEERGVSARVHVLGYRANASRYLPLADVLVLPSRNEGLPIAVLEAFRASRPVVGSAIPEIAEAVENGRTGILFEPGNPAALAAGLRHALEPMTRLAMGRAAGAVFGTRYRADRMLAEYGRLYADLAPRGRRLRPLRVARVAS
jgi:glycosyltransferase involved in cell wall biosynthesis